MHESIEKYVENLDDKTKIRFMILYELIHHSTSERVEEKLWAKLPSFYVGENFVRIIPFKDHINIEAKSVIQNKESLKEFKITPKGMLQIQHIQGVPKEVLKKIIKESFE
ncbi:hypothetical protein [Desulfogranum japonicum]|uniref:hypothetical protein n=1 Tax=Desulfogranum japonicum TaxID=231447 RepID=UPI00041BBB27|nr:hypothetical protein [Desulfogranum japonicum]